MIGLIVGALVGHAAVGPVGALRWARIVGFFVARRASSRSQARKRGRARRRASVRRAECARPSHTRDAIGSRSARSTARHRPRSSGAVAALERAREDPNRAPALRSSSASTGASTRTRCDAAFADEARAMPAANARRRRIAGIRPADVRTPDGTPEPRRADATAAAATAVAARAARRRAAAAPNPLWAWFTGGNALTRVGIVVLFFGVAFLLSYFAEIRHGPDRAAASRRSRASASR